MDNAESDADYSALAFETGETGTRRLQTARLGSNQLQWRTDSS